jgi:fibronectin type 3 domain-containing protein
VTGNQTLYARWLKTPVSGLTAQSASYGSIKLAWAASSGADYYEIYRATSSTGTYSLIKTLAASAQTYTDAGITTGKLYYYKIRAYAQIGGSKVFNGYSAIVSAKPVPAVPASFMAVSASYNSIKLSWAPVAGATGYKIYRATSSTGTYSLLRTTTATSYTNIYLTTGKAYYYKIRAYRTVGTASFYSGYTASLGTRPVPAVPGAFTVTRYSATSIKAAWSAVSGGSGYEVWRATSSTGAYSLLKATTATSLTDTGLTTGRYYYYKVRAYHLEGTAKIYGSFAAVKYTKP